MKINANLLKLMILFLISPLFNILLMGQAADAVYNSSGSYLERLVINTDRKIYITGEKVHLKVYEMNGHSCIPSGLSKIVYLELLDISNNPVNQVKIRIDGTSGSGDLRLSDTLSSGNYLIRAYTAWMQNSPDDLFSYDAITIINPFKAISDLTPTASGSTENKVYLYSGSTLASCNTATGDQVNILVTPDRSEYGTRERVRLNIFVTGINSNPKNADLTVSVVKRFLAGNHQEYQIDRIVNEVPKVFSTDSATHLPELEGQLISGVILNKATYEPLKETDISLSFVGKTARCQFMKTNTKGEFNFVDKDQIGPGEIVIQPFSPDMPGFYVELSQPFYNTYNGFSPPEFRPDSSMAESINNAIISMQVNNIYMQAKGRENTGTPIDTYDFFGKPDRRVSMADYIELDNIREVIKEILPEVVMFRKDRQPALKVISSNPYMIFENQALVLLDGVPVNNIEKLLDVSSKELESIEIIRERYFYSDYIFEGIISFVSKKGDLSAIESDNSVYRQQFEGYLGKEDFYAPDYSIDPAGLSRIPDFRNTLYWNPGVITSADGSASVEFFTSDEKMEYIIIIDGFTSDGKRVYYSGPLMVN